MSYHKEYSGLGFGVFSCSMKSSLTVVSFFPFSFLAFLSAQGQVQREKSSGGEKEGKDLPGSFFLGTMKIILRSPRAGLPLNLIDLYQSVAACGVVVASLDQPELSPESHGGGGYLNKISKEEMGKEQGRFQIDN